MKNLLNSTFIILTIINIQWIYVYSQKEIDNKCVVQYNRAIGTCKLITKCPIALAELKAGKKLTVCGYLNLQQIVCCTDPLVTTTEKPIPPELLNTKRAKKCREYAKAVYETVSGMTLTEGTAFKKEIDRCGVTAIPLIVGGVPALSREFPHSALLGYQTPDGKIAWGCGGSLISPDFVLTAGHCLRSRDNGEVKYIKLGDLNIASEKDDARPETFMVQDIIPHPSYKSSSQYNDIALIRLKGQVKLNPYIRPICLPLVNTTNISTKKAIATGWGSVEFASDSSSALLKVTLELFNHKECNESYQYNINRKLKDGIVDDTQLCAGSRTEQKDTCQGDSGGPLQIYHPDVYCMYIIIGVTSFGRACGTINVPGIYTRVSAFVDWIESVVWP